MTTVNLELFLRGALAAALANSGINAKYSTNLVGDTYNVTLYMGGMHSGNDFELKNKLTEAMLKHADAAKVTLPQDLKINVVTTNEVGPMDRKAALKELSKLARKQHEILTKLAQDAAHLPLPTSTVDAGAKALEGKVKAKLEELMPGSSHQVQSLSFGELNSNKPYVFMKYLASGNSNELKAAVTNAARQVLGKDVVLQATGEF